MRKELATSLLLTVVMVANPIFAEDFLLPDGLHHVQNVSNESLSEKSDTIINSVPKKAARPMTKLQPLTDIADELDIQVVTESLEDITADISKIDINPYDEIVQAPIYTDDLSYKYHSSMSKKAQDANTDTLALINHYMEKAAYIPVRDPKWVIALGAIEYNYVSQDPGLIFSWPIDLNTYSNDVLLGYNWQYIRDHYGDDAVYRRTGGAIGPLQCESFFGEGVTPIIPEEFGLIGTNGTARTDCWTYYGSNPGSGTDITWKYGTKADRWSVADATNLTLGVYNETMRRTNYQAEIYNMSKYEQITLLMWGHNAGTGIINQRSRIDIAKEIATHRDEIYEVISRVKPSRFTRSSQLLPTINKIAGEVGCPDYPVMSLMSYMIVEARYNGEW